MPGSTTKWPAVDESITSLINSSGIALASGKNVNVIQALTSDHSWSGVTATMTAGTALAIGNACYIGAADSKLEKAKADAVGTMPALCVATAAIAEDATGEVLLLGFLRDDTFAFTAGAILYISEATAGLITETRPATATNQVQVVGVAITATIILWCPSYILVGVS